MWSADIGNERLRAMSNGLRHILVVSAMLALSACTVRPLYQQGGTQVPGSMAAELASIEVSEVFTRDAQEVRNQLIFLFTGGATRTPDPRYVLDLRIKSSSANAADLQSGDAEDPTAKTVTMTAIYTLRDASDGKAIARGRRAITSAFDVPDQNFAAVRAERDAENRAARELAEVLHLSVAQDLARYQRDNERKLPKVVLEEPETVPDDPLPETSTFVRE